MAKIKARLGQADGSEFQWGSIKYTDISRHAKGGEDSSPRRCIDPIRPRHFIATTDHQGHVVHNVPWGIESLHNRDE